ncbi:replication-associated recombination protein A [Caldicellulosiruptoraceae bacterium PP1]
MDLFNYASQSKMKKESPLALKLRPQTIDDIVGQDHILGKGKPLYNLIMADKLSSIILYGPPGTGKTTLAYAIANTTKKYFETINATLAGISDIKKVIEESKYRLVTNNQRTILFIDEIHRFNKQQQDALLPSVEEGTIILIGATTENPFFEVNKALISRSLVFELLPLDNNSVKKILYNAISNKEKGLGFINIKIDEDSINYIVTLSNGDARTALNILEATVYATKANENDEIVINIKSIEGLFNRKALYDTNSDMHYDTISAFIKSMRGSDPDATLYYLAKMIDSGEDIRFIARRIMICAAEDVGLADPNALVVASAAAYAADFVGLPEARIILSEAALYIACAPKSNSSIVGIEKALEDVRNIPIKTIPFHLRTPNLKATDIGHGIGYKYPHDYKNNYIKQQYLPDELINKKYFYPTNNGYEHNIINYLEGLQNENISDENGEKDN